MQLDADRRGSRIEGLRDSAAKKYGFIRGNQLIESEWTDRISRQILLYQKRGIIEMKKTKWWRSKGATCSGVGSALKQQRISLNLYNVSGLFLILFLGLFFSAVTVMVEFCIRSKEIARRDNVNICEIQKEPSLETVLDRVETRVIFGV